MRIFTVFNKLHNIFFTPDVRHCRVLYSDFFGTLPSSVFVKWEAICGILRLVRRLAPTIFLTQSETGCKYTAATLTSTVIFPGAMNHVVHRCRRSASIQTRCQMLSPSVSSRASNNDLRRGGSKLSQQRAISRKPLDGYCSSLPV